MADWDKDKPADSDLVSQFPANERDARGAVETNFGIDHHEADDGDVGKHEIVQMLVQTTPTAVAGQGHIYTKDVGSGVVELFFQDKDGNEIQLTDAGAIINFPNLSGDVTADEGEINKLDGLSASKNDLDVAANGAAGESKEAAFVPAGMVMACARTSAPTGWLECDGSAVSRTTYSILFSAIGTVYGNGDGSTTFNLPDYRGEFLRGYDNGAGNDPDAASRTNRGDGTTGDNIGTKQADAFQGHFHNPDLGRAGAANSSNGAAFMGGDGPVTNTRFSAWNGSGGSDLTSDGTNGTPRSTSETRPTNISVMWCIKT